MKRPTSSPRRPVARSHRSTSQVGERRHSGAALSPGGAAEISLRPRTRRRSADDGEMGGKCAGRRVAAQRKFGVCPDAGCTDHDDNSIAGATNHNDNGRHAACDADPGGRHDGVVVRAERRCAAGPEVVVQPLSGELRLRPGVHGRVGLAGDLRGGVAGPVRDFRVVDDREPDRPGRAADLSAGGGGRGRGGGRLPVCDGGVDGQQHRRPAGGREGEPAVGMAAAAGGGGGAGGDQAADGG